MLSSSFKKIPKVWSKCTYQTGQKDGFGIRRRTGIFYCWTFSGKIINPNLFTLSTFLEERKFILRLLVYSTQNLCQVQENYGVTAWRSRMQPDKEGNRGKDLCYAFSRWIPREHTDSYSDSDAAGGWATHPKLRYPSYSSTCCPEPVVFTYVTAYKRAGFAQKYGQKSKKKLIWTNLFIRYVYSIFLSSISAWWICSQGGRNGSLDWAIPLAQGM